MLRRMDASVMAAENTTVQWTADAEVLLSRSSSSAIARSSKAISTLWHCLLKILLLDIVKGMEVCCRAK